MERQQPEGAAVAVETDAEITDLEEAIARHDSEWVLMHVMESDENWQPLRGIVLTHSKSRADLSVELAKQPLRSTLSPDAPYRPYYSFFAMPFLRPGESEEQGRVRYAAQRAAVLEGRRVEPGE